MITARRERLLQSLCQQVRVVTEGQAGALMAPAGSGPAAISRELAALVTRDYLRRDRVIARRPQLLTGPIARWQHGDPPPDFAALAWQLEKRWDVPPQVLPVYRAGPAARAVFGSGTCRGGLNLAALGHDLAITDMLLAFAGRAAERVGHWVGEDLRKGDLAHGEKLPDVILYGADLAPYLVCEVAGAYPKWRLEALHAYVAQQLNLPYELW